MCIFCIFNFRAQLTVGRVDGRGGRGSFAGLEDALQSVLDGISIATSASGSTAGSEGGATPSFLLECLRVGETVLSYSSEVPVRHRELTAAGSGSNKKTDPDSAAKPHQLDLIVKSVWLPVAEVVQERFSDMFSIGIPSTLSRCYRCMRQFLQKLQALCGAPYTAGIARRLASHSLVTAFFGQWKLEMYFQLRCKEVFVRVDKACESAHRYGAAGPQSVLDDLYFSPPSATGSGTSVDVSPHIAVRAEVEAQMNKLGGMQSPAFFAAALELRACLHPSVLLEPLVRSSFTYVNFIVSIFKYTY